MIHAYLFTGGFGPRAITFVLWLRSTGVATAGHDSTTLFAAFCAAIGRWVTGYETGKRAYAAAGGCLSMGNLFRDMSNVDLVYELSEADIMARAAVHTEGKCNALPALSADMPTALATDVRIYLAVTDDSIPLFLLPRL